MSLPDSSDEHAARINIATAVTAKVLVSILYLPGDGGLTRLHETLRQCRYDAN
jgi:hypothetical protein